MIDHVYTQPSIELSQKRRELAPKEDAAVIPRALSAFAHSVIALETMEHHSSHSR